MAKKAIEPTTEDAVTEAEVVETKPVKATAAKKKAVKAKTDMSKVDDKQLAQMRQDYFKHRLEVAEGKSSDTAKLKTMRRDIARVMMYLHINNAK